MKKAVKESRKFIISLGLAITSGVILSRALMMWVSSINFLFEIVNTLKLFFVPWPYL